MSTINEQSVINVMRNTVTEGTKTGARVEYRFGEVSDVDAQTASVYLDGNTTASAGFRIPLDMELDIGDHVRVAIAYDSNLGKWVEEIMQCDDRLSDSGCSRTVVILSDHFQDNLSIESGLGNIFVHNSSSHVARYRKNLEFVWEAARNGGSPWLSHEPGSHTAELLGDKAIRYEAGAVRWDISGSITAIQAQCMDNRRFWVSTTSGKLQTRHMTDGSFVEEITLSSDGLELRRTPVGQDVFVRQGTGTIKRYDKSLDLQATISISSFFPCDEWNVDDSYNIYRLSSGVLKKYSPTGVLKWTSDLFALKGYRYPTLNTVGVGNGQVITAEENLLVAGYIGDATWTTDSKAALLTISKATGEVKFTQVFGGGTGAQALGFHRTNDGCPYMFGFAIGTEFEDTAISAMSGWIMRLGVMPENDSNGEGGDDTSHTHTMSLDDLSDVETSSPYTPSDGDVLTYSSAYSLWIPGEGTAGTLTVEEDGVSEESPVTTINFTTGFDVTNTSDGEVEIALSSAYASDYGGVWDVWITKSADEDVTSSTTLQDDNELVYAGTVNNGFYEFELFILMACPGAGGAPDIKFSVGEDTTFRGYAARLAGNSGTGAAEYTPGSVDLDVPFTAQTGTTPFGIWVRGSWTSGGSTFKLQWAQNGTNVNPVRVYAGSTLKIKRLV